MGLVPEIKDFMTAKRCFKYNHPTKPIRLILYMYGWFDLKPLFLVRLRPEQLTRNQMASQPGGTSSPSISLGHNGWGLKGSIFVLKVQEKTNRISQATRIFCLICVLTS